MLKLEVALEDVESALARMGTVISLRIGGGKVFATKLGVEVAIGPATCDVKQGLVILPIEVVDAPGAFLGGKAVAKKVLFGKLRATGVPELSVDDARSALVLDGKRLLGRVAPAFADYAVTELTFVDRGARGAVVLQAVSVSA